MSRNRGVHETSVSWSSPDKGQVEELAGRPIGGLLLLEATNSLFFFRLGPKIIDLLAANGPRGASFRPLFYSKF